MKITKWYYLFSTNLFINRYQIRNAIKYIARAGKKNPENTIEDLKKALWYINYKIKVLESDI